MSTEDIIRAWKDPYYRRKLDKKKLAILPDHPAGLIELNDADLGSVAGGDTTVKTTPPTECPTYTCCTSTCTCTVSCTGAVCCA